MQYVNIDHLSFQNAKIFDIAPRVGAPRTDLETLRARIIDPASFSKAGSIEDLGSLCLDLVDVLGFDNFLIGVYLPFLPKTELRKVLNGYPSDWVKAYLSRAYVDVDPVVARQMASLVPFEWWELDFAQASPDAPAFFMEAFKYGVSSGLSFRHLGPAGSIGMINFSTAKPGFRLGDRREEVMGIASLFATRLMDAVVRIYEPFSVQKKHLTKRQILALQLLSEGETNKIIARKMGVDEHTVEYHLRRIYAAMGVANRGEAIAKGTQLGVIARHLST